ncbi:hypothetical protein [Enterococcus sp. AZ072]
MKLYNYQLMVDYCDKELEVGAFNTKEEIEESIDVTEGILRKIN